MNKYESVIITKPAEESAINVEDKFSELIEKNGNLTKLENLGIRQLAYQVKGYEKGHYLIYHFESEAEFIGELERQFRLDENIIKFIVIKVEE